MQIPKQHRIIMYFGFCLLVLQGCATAAQNRAQAINAGATTANSQMQACVAAIYASPSGVLLADKIAINGSQPTLQQLADQTFPDDAQVAAIYEVNRMAQDCRKAFLVAYNAIAPGIALVSMDAFQKADQEALLLVQKKITWGDYNSAIQKQVADYAKAVQAEAQKVNVALQQENAAEMEQRQRAAAAYLQYMQNQQAINAMNRPITTNCNTFGTMTNCTTH